MAEDGLSEFGRLLVWVGLAFLSLGVISLLLRERFPLLPPQWLPVLFAVFGLCVLNQSQGEKRRDMG